MTLAFPNASRSYEAERRAIRFWGHESQFEFTFYVDADALHRLDPRGLDDEASLLRTFDANRPRIEKAAGVAHARGKQSFYRLTASEF
ncbi:DUF1488 domain-containing protein [Phreatobacter aquaticus]|uniref:DUF1488 domain-containing protein n=1 Tax=Phreatobacter aquaticus TaxID=2570229 RepID=A0A4D7QJX9_9HYPH|nr:DUF1488 family protein [Phreatobacter aquaticus]QCK85664.1 DUF1488 domain-containing protein [Phreatobacter aquaticus]